MTQMETSTMTQMETSRKVQVQTPLKPEIREQLKDVTDHRTLPQSGLMTTHRSCALPP